ncbi:hypothetical protein WJX81_005173 [Elliptochloris bilobata]|uniref:Purple acid phosphatase N-terminal domain-containing protein n=1 Tax=Elliptochloris bilobata TaxID=381761 RepID=A0AAW1RGE9_9CHLO
MSLASGPLTRTVNGTLTEQIRTAYYAADAVVISWATGGAQAAHGPLIPLDISAVASTRMPGTTHPLSCTMCCSGTWQPNTTYFYQVGDGARSQSNVTSFKTLPRAAAGVPPAASRIGVLGDLGVTRNSSATVARLAQSRADAYLYLGEFSYADMYLSNGMATPCHSHCIGGCAVQGSVDVVLSAHVNAYERTLPMFNIFADPCGPTYITVGSGGSPEGLGTDYADTPG